MAKNIALFDFDGTITTKDTMFEFIRFVAGPVRFVTGMLFVSPVLVSVKAGLISAQSGKETLLGHFFKHMPEKDFTAHGRRFCEQKIPELIRPGALKKITEHKENGDDVVIVTASALQWVKPWADKYNIPVLATALAADFNGITGKLDGINCNGEEKVKRIRAGYDLSAYQSVYCYGDSKGDLPMLSLATNAFFKPFR